MNCDCENFFSKFIVLGVIIIFASFSGRVYGSNYNQGYSRQEDGRFDL